MISAQMNIMIALCFFTLFKPSYSSKLETVSNCDMFPPMMQKLCLRVAKIWHVKDEGYVMSHDEGEFVGSATNDRISNTIQEKTNSGKTIKMGGIRNFMDCPVKHCMSCHDQNTCSSCKPGFNLQFHFDKEHVICVKKCFMGYAPKIDATGNRICKQKSIPDGCLDLFCSVCKRGYFMMDNATTKSPCSKSCPEGYLKDRVRRKCVFWDL